MRKRGKSGKAIVSTAVGGIAAALSNDITATFPAVWPLLLPAFAGAVGEEASRRIMEDRSRRTKRYVAKAEQVSARSFEDLVAAALDNEELRDLLSHTVRSAMETRDEWIIDRLAEIYVCGVDDDDRIDELQLIVDALGQLGRLHIRLLRILIKKGPNVGASEKLGRNTWPIGDIRAEDPALGEALDVLTGRLQMLGMVERMDLDGWGQKFGYALTPFGMACSDDLVRRADKAGRADASTV